ncbi:MAG: hypothetical protein ACJ8EQ_10465 [Sphingomicrobium sp.]
MFSTVALAAALAQAAVLNTPEQEARLQATLSLAVAKMASQSACDFAKPRPSDLLVTVGTSGGSILPTVTVAGQDEITMLSDLVITKGRNPVYLVLVSEEATIWRLAGDVRRVRQVIVFHDEGAGVIGVPASRIHFNRQDRCRLSKEIYRGRSLETDVPILAMFGRRANAIGGDYVLYKATVDGSKLVVDRTFAGSGHDLVISDRDATVFPKPAVPGPSTLEREFRANFPAGIVEVEPADVVATGPVERYQVMPATAGALELERSGALIPATAADVRRWKERAILSGHVRADRINELTFYQAYRVTRPIRVPPGLCGAFSMTFFVPLRGYLTGDLCHSSIFVDDGTAEGEAAHSLDD